MERIFISAAKGLGELVKAGTSSSDVSEEYYDVEARIRGAVTDLNGNEPAREGDSERIQVGEEQRWHGEL